MVPLGVNILLSRYKSRVGDYGSPDSQDFAMIASVRSGSAAAPTQGEGGDDSILVLESLELATREMSAGDNGGVTRPQYSLGLPWPFFNFPIVLSSGSLNRKEYGHLVPCRFWDRLA